MHLIPLRRLSHQCYTAKCSFSDGSRTGLLARSSPSPLPKRDLGLLKGTKFPLQPSPSVSHRPNAGDHHLFCCDIYISFVPSFDLLYILGFLVRIHGEVLFHSFMESILNERVISKHFVFVCFRIGSSNRQKIFF